MLVEDAIARRHSTTEFTEKLVLHSMVNEIVRKSTSTPNFNGRRNFRVVIIHREEDNKIKIANTLAKYGKANDDIISTQDSEYISKASALILIYKTKSRPNNKNDLITLGALGENISLMATNHYIGTLWIDSVVNIEDQIANDILHLKGFDKCELCYGIVLGHRDRLYSYKRDSIMPESVVYH